MTIILESLYQDVESICNSDSGLLRLVQALLEHQPNASPAVRNYVAALMYYVFHCRRKTIYKQSDKLLQSPCGVNTGCGPFIDWEQAREYVRGSALETVQAELTATEIQDIKNRVGRLPLRAILARIRDSRFEVPR